MLSRPCKPNPCEQRPFSNQCCLPAAEGPLALWPASPSLRLEQEAQQLQSMRALQVMVLLLGKWVPHARPCAPTFVYLMGSGLQSVHVVHAIPIDSMMCISGMHCLLAPMLRLLFTCDPMISTSTMRWPLIPVAIDILTWVTPLALLYPLLPATSAKV